MTNLKNTTGNTNTYTLHYDISAQVVITAMIKKGYTTITLSKLYDTLGADTKQTKNEVKWALRRAKTEGLISKTPVRGVYTVNWYKGG